jgi:hypothetical protein
MDYYGRKNRKQIKKSGRKPKIDPAVHRYSINLNAEDNAKFLALLTNQI